MNKQLRDAMIEWVNSASDVIQTIASGSSATRAQCVRLINSQRILEDAMVGMDKREIEKFTK